MPKALLLSPHLDDVAFSCGGAARRLADAGWEAVLCTVFTRSVPDPQGFALACQLDKGLGPEVDYMALRRGEDAEAAGHLGASEVLWLDLPEAPHRGYGSAPALFGPLSPEDDVQPELEAALAPLLASHDIVLAPQGIGGHVDHRLVRDAVLRLAPAARTAWYRDAPYAVRHPEARPAPEVAEAGREAAVPLGEGALEAKLGACAAYASQLGFQFGGVGPMRAALAGFARAEAVRLGAAAPFAEAVIAPEGAALHLPGG
jgi:LmbE family N-acetylglucosaminyl deacetylase